MKTQTDVFPNLIHIYAVDIGEKTFPMEIYWSVGRQEVEGWMVNPIGVEQLKGRHEKYMQVHSVTYEDFKNFGKSPKTLCEMLNDSFADNEVYVADEELEWTKFLLKELYSVSQIQMKNFVLSPLYDFLMEKVQSREVLESLKEKAGEKYAVGGAAKFFYLKDLTELVLNENSFQK
jgi:hypothetical protein